MTPHLNTRARLERALRNNQKIYSSWEMFRKFKWFTLAIAVIMPVYPSLSVLGYNYEAMAGDYDESTIITAYEGDDQGDGGLVLSENGMLSTDFDTVASIDVPKQLDTPKEVKKPLNEYVVTKGDTIGKIAKKYGISEEALLWANDMSIGDAITAGEKLRIPPVSGVVHIVQKWDTISEIAAKYKVDADDIVRVNGLKSAASIRTGLDLMIPGAARQITPTRSEKKEMITSEKPAPAKQITSEKSLPVKVNSDGLKSRYVVKYTGLSRGFAWGNCTWYVAQHKSISWRGNANQWLKNAKAAGVKTGQKPVPGAVIQFSGRGYNRYYGHVGIVMDVTDDYVIVKDMNYRSLNEVTIRKVAKSDATIDGYIYVD